MKVPLVCAFLPHFLMSSAKCLRLTWDKMCVKICTREAEGRGNEVGWEETQGDRFPFLAWSSSLSRHINAKGPDSVPAKHSAVFSD